MQQAKAYNKGRRLVENIKEGDYVLVNPHTLKLVDSQGLGAKLVQRTIGPFKVMEQINPLVYHLRLLETYPMHLVFNLEHFLKYRQSDSRFGERTHLPTTHDFLASEEYEVEAILGHRLASGKNGNQQMYLV
jgi:intein/homing endonuclease